MKIEIWSDYSCPFCYIGKTSLKKALAELGMEGVTLIPRGFQLDPQAPKSTSLSAAEGLAKKYGVPVAEAKRMIANVAGTAQRAGLVMDFDKVQSTNTFDAHRLVKGLPEVLRGQLEMRLFEGYFVKGENLADPAVLKKMAIEVGAVEADIDAALAGDNGRVAVEADIAMARRFGIRGVPYFLINGKTVISGAQPYPEFLRVLKDEALKEIKRSNNE